VTLATAFNRLISLCDRIPHSAIALVGRVAAAATFWTAGQAKVDGLVIDIFRLRFDLGRPRISETSLELFTYLYRIHVARPDVVFLIAAVTEHMFAALLFVGLATRFSALVLLVVTAAIEFFVYPEAYATYGLWVATLLYLVARGAGFASSDHALVRLLKSRDTMRRPPI